MPLIDHAIIERILDVARIEDVVGDFVELKKKGIRYLGLCPFHDDRHLGSFVVYPTENCYVCFACEAKGGVVDFLMRHAKMSYPDAIRYLGKKYSIDTDMTDFDYTPPPPKPVPPPLPVLELPKSMVKAREVITAGENPAARDNLVEWIRTGVKWDSVARERIDKMLTDYHVGHSKQGHTIFWQIDEQGKVRTGKMMLYLDNGHRDKVSHWNFDFVHSLLKRRYDDHGNIVEEGAYPFPDLFNPEKQEAVQTLFGMHLLNKYGNNATVNIVESEKTALLMAIAYGNNIMQVWMACGGKQNIKREMLAPIIAQHRKIVFYPDRDAIDEWRIKVDALGYDRAVMDTTPVTKWWRAGDGDKADIADVVIRIINESQLQNIDDVKKEMPKTEKLIDKFDCEIV